MRLRTLYVDQGLSKKAIARELGCSDTTVAAAVRHFRLSRPERPKLSEEDRQLVVGMYKSEGLPVRTIAARTALGRDKILEVLRAADVPLRGRGARAAERLDADRVRRAYEGGASLRGLARAVGTDDGVIRETLLGAGVPVRRQGRIPKWQHVLTAAFLQQKHIEDQQSLSDIAQQVGCSYQTVLDAVHRHGIATRGGRSRPGQSG